MPVAALIMALCGCAIAQPAEPAATASTATSAPAPKKWTCEAPNLISATYGGGDWASVHLSPYSSGGSYRVTKEGATATGVTANGTKFICTQK